MCDIPKDIIDMLDADENLLWHGKSRTDIVLSAKDWFQLRAVSALASTVLLTVATFAVTTNMKLPLWASLFTILPAVGGILLYLFAQAKHRKSLYFVTDKRVAVKRDTILDRTIKYLEYDLNFSMTPIDGPKGTASIYFGTTSAMWNIMYPYSMYHPPTFMFIDNAKKVMDLITEAKYKATSAR